MSRAHPESREAAAHPPNPPRVDEPLRLIHHHPGYLRAWSNAFLGPLTDVSSVDVPAVAGARAAAEATAGFRRWAHNPKTGSIVVEYEPGAVDADDLLKHIATRAGLQGVETKASKSRTREELVTGFLDFVQNINTAVLQATGGAADLRELVPAALLATGLASFVFHDERGRLPRWDTAVYHAYRIFWNWHRDEINGRLKTDWRRSKDEAAKKAKVGT